MKVTLVTSALAEALAVAGRSVGADKSLPTVGHVLIEATPDGGLTLTGDNHGTRSWQTVPADVDRPGSVCLRESALAGFLDAVSEHGDVEISVSNGRAVLACGPTTVRVGGLDAEGFPRAPGLDTILAELRLEAGVFAALAESTLFAADTKPDNTVRNCAHLAVRGGRIIFEATDFLRVARAVTATDGADLDVLAPASALATAVKLAGTTDTIGVTVTPTHLIVDATNGRCAVALGQGQFPNVDRIIPRESTSRVVVDRAALARALKLVRRLEKTAIGYRVDIAIRDGEMELHASDRASDHDAQTTIPIDLDGDVISLAMTATHLDQALGALDAHERAEMVFNGPNHPVLVRAIGDASIEQTHVLMPILKREA